MSAAPALVPSPPNGAATRWQQLAAALIKAGSAGSLAEAAPDYATEAGQAVHPLRPNAKTPITSRGFKDATADVDIVRQWWQRWATANIGLL